jgi:PAS domain S-box-containing protein
MSFASPLDLCSAIDKHEIVPWFQPIVDFRTGRLSGFEVLARWQHPQRGMVPPSEFIPLAESTALIGPLMDLILVQAFEAAASFPRHVTLSVNISPLQLRDRLLPEQMRRAAEQGGFSPQKLIFEITESSLVLNLDLGARIAKDLKALGAQLALDDFGTGYSCLRHLQALPFDKIKIDASFVQSMTSQPESRKIVAAVVGLGLSLGLETVGEGIEKKEHADLLFSLGCDLGQGWWYGRPMPATELAAFLAKEEQALQPNDVVSVVADVALNLEAMPAQRLAQLQAIYDGAPVGLAFLDRNLRYVSVNERIATMKNIPVQDHIGRSVAEVVPDVFPHIEPALRRALAGESISGLEFRIPNSNQPDGYSNLLNSYQPIRDAADEIVGISVATMDITERMRLEQALAESDDHFRQTLEQHPALLWTADAEGMITDVGMLTGVAKEEALGDGWIKGVHPEDAARAARVWQEAVFTGQPYDIEYRCRGENGSWRWMRARAKARRGASGELTQWYGTLEVIDDRRKAEEVPRESEARLHAAFNAVQMGIVIAAPDGRIVMSNPRAEAIFGCSSFAGSEMGLYQSALFYPDGEPVRPEQFPLTRALEGCTVTDPEEFLYRRGDGSLVWIYMIAAPTRDGDGVVTGAVVAITDADLRPRF